MEQENNEKTAIIADVQPVKQEKKTTRKPRQTRKKAGTKKKEDETPIDDKPTVTSSLPENGRGAREEDGMSTTDERVEKVEEHDSVVSRETDNPERKDEGSRQAKRGTQKSRRTKKPGTLDEVRNMPQETVPVDNDETATASQYGDSATEEDSDRNQAPANGPTTPTTDNAVPAEAPVPTSDGDSSSPVANQSQAADVVDVKPHSSNGSTQETVSTPQSAGQEEWRKQQSQTVRQQTSSQTAKPLPPCPTLVIHNIVELVNAPSRQLLLTDQQIQQLSAEEAAQRFRWIEGTLALVLDYDIVISDTNIWLELLTGHTSSHSDPRFNCRLQFERQLEFISKLTRHRCGRFMMMSETYEEIDRFASQMEPQSHSDSDFSDDEVCRNIAARLAKRLILSQQRENRLRIEGIGAESHHSAFADPAIIRRCVELFAQGRRVLLLTNDASVAIRSMGMCDDLQRTNGIDDETWDTVYAPLRPMVMTMDDLKAIDAYTRQYHFLQMATGKAWMEDVPRQMRKNDVAPLALWMEGFRPGDRHSERKQNSQQRKQNSQPKPKQESQPKPKQESQSKPKQESQPKPKQEPQPKPKQEQQPKPKQEPQPKPKQEQQSKPKQESQPKPKQEPQPKPKQESQPKPKQEPQPKPKQEQQPKPKQEQQPKPKQESQSVQSIDVQPAPQEMESQNLQAETKPARRLSRKKKTADSDIQTSAESANDISANENAAGTADIQEAAAASEPKRQGRSRQTRRRQKQGGETSSAS